MKKRWSLFATIMTLISAVVIFSLLMTDILISNLINDHTKNSLEEKALTIARIVAKTELVQNALEGDEEARNNIQSYTKDIQLENGVEFVVILDMDGIRLTHPDVQKIGKKFQGGDEVKPMSGKEQTSVSKGTLGKSMRAFTPVYSEEGKQIGVAAVGISLAKVNEVLAEGKWIIVYGSMLGLLAGIIGAYILARYIKRVMFNMEPAAIAKLLQERSAVINSVREGIIAVDMEGNITLVNQSAIDYLHKTGLNANPIGQPISSYIPSKGLNRVLETGKAQLDEEQIINGTTILVNRVPVKVDNKIVGALFTFRDKTEIKKLSDQLSGVKTYAEALRAQSHEFMNRMQVIIGMLHMKNYDRLKDYLDDIVDQQSGDISAITSNIKDPVIAGLLLGKLSYAREKGASLKISILTVIPELTAAASFEIITIIGNLLDNALDAVETSSDKDIELKLIMTNGMIDMIVKDTGKGMTKEDEVHIFEKGISSKGENRGFGLYLVSESLRKLNGTIEVKSVLNIGTTFKASIPYMKEENRS